MKKILFVAALSLGSLTAFAQEGEATEEATVKVSIVQDDFSAIETSELPEAVSNAVATNYPTATIEKAYVSKKEQYKLELALEDGTAATFFADKDGNWIDL
ncbi:hypothetical protein [Arenibacter amylolyticus]|uniref:hypothetical protein n=1 Tax=Arenibacter amylolyticus TaxID=1406873 RepID=UPI000A3A861C|nr:hypothetical protein [Arenibacter amylolyticus]